MSLRQQFLDAADGDPTHAAVHLARALMEGDTSSLKVGYSQVNAVTAASELFPEVTPTPSTMGLTRAWTSEPSAAPGWWSISVSNPGRLSAATPTSPDADRLDAALDDLADRIVDGQAPDGVYDLDTGKKIDIHVSTPIVTVSEDQGASLNPLES